MNSTIEDFQKRSVALRSLTEEINGPSRGTLVSHLFAELASLNGYLLP